MECLTHTPNTRKLYIASSIEEGYTRQGFATRNSENGSEKTPASTQKDYESEKELTLNIQTLGARSMRYSTRRYSPEKNLPKETNRQTANKSRNNR